MNVGTLKQLLAGIPDETPIISQIVDQQGNAWNLHLAVYADNSPMNAVLIQLSHPQLIQIPRDTTDAPTCQESVEAVDRQGEMGCEVSPPPAVPDKKSFRCN